MNEIDQSTLDENLTNLKDMGVSPEMFKDVYNDVTAALAPFLKNREMDVRDIMIVSTSILTLHIGKMLGVLCASSEHPPEQYERIMGAIATTINKTMEKSITDLDTLIRNATNGL